MSDIRAALERYAKGPDALAAAVKGLSPAHLDALPIPGTWSIRQIVVHLLDSDLAATHRMRRIVAEDLPLIIAYDETAFASRLAYERADIALVLRLFADTRRFTRDWLDTLPPDAFARAGVHNHRGKVTLADIVRMYADHVDHHLAFITKKRSLLGV